MKNKLNKIFKILNANIKRIKREIGALYLACKRPDVPLYAKVVSILVVGYALSPIDLIPDFIPILGYVDDLLLVPMGVFLAIKLMPKDIMDECRLQLDDIFKDGKPKNWIAGALIIGIWIILIIYVLMKISN